MNDAEGQWLRRYRDTGDADAFSQLLRRHVDLVYSAALRQTGDDSSAAEDVTQTVFIALARKADTLADHPCLSGWLYASVRIAAAEYRRAEARRRLRETRFAAMNDPICPPNLPEWDRIRPVLDAAMEELPDDDRDAVVLRFFERRSHAEIGQRLGISENSARMRVSRALEKLRRSLEGRGVVSVSEALGMLLAQHAVGAVPGALADRITSAVLDGASLPTRGFLGLCSSSFRSWSLAGLSVLTAIALIRWGIQGFPVLKDLSGPVAVASVRTAETGIAEASKPRASDVAATAAQPDAGVAGPGADLDRILTVTVVDRRTGGPIPQGALRQRMTRAAGPMGMTSRTLSTTVEGMVSIPVPPDVRLLELITRIDGYADTRLQWEPPHGHTIPTNYIVLLDPGIPLGGTVLDPAGAPAAGAEVVVSLMEKGSTVQGPESREFGSMTAVTDSAGRWTLARVGSDVLSRCSFRATHPDFQPSDPLWLQDATDGERALRNRTQILRLTRSRTLKGIVADEFGQGIADAQVLVLEPSPRDAVTDGDGSFLLSGCPVSNHWVLVTASGFAPARFAIRPASADEPVRLSLERSAVMKVRVRDEAGMPVSNAWFGLSGEPPPKDDGFPTAPPVSLFRGLTDAEGRCEWLDAPKGTSRYDFVAEGFEPRYHVGISGDGAEYEVTLKRTVHLTVHGEVVDANDGRSIPAFKVGLGYLALDQPDWKPRVRFMDDERSWLRFEGGRFDHVFRAPLITGTGDSRVVIKVEAEGYEPWFSRPLQLNEGDVPMAVQLHPTKAIRIVVRLPDGRPAADAEVGLVRAGDRYWLKGTHFNRERGIDPAVFHTTDASGAVCLRREGGVSQVLVAHDLGFVRVPMSSLVDGGEVRLEPWAQIEVELDGSERGPGGAWVRLPDSDSGDLELDFAILDAVSGHEKHVRFPSIPPGEWAVSEIRRVVNSDDSITSQPGRTRRVPLGAGEVARVSFAPSGYRVTGRVQVPAGFVIPPHSKWMGRLAWNAPDLPEPPKEVRGNFELMAKWQHQPGIREALAVVQARSRFLAVAKDGTFTADSVESGDYRFELVLLTLGDEANGAGVSRKTGPILQIQRAISVPSSPESGELDLGLIALEAVPRTALRNGEQNRNPSRVP